MTGRFTMLSVICGFLAVAVGCAGLAAPPPGPVVSPTGIVYEPGTPPANTRFAEAAMLYLSRNLYEEALRLADEGIEANPENPIHYFVAGIAYVGLDRFEEADEVWREAQRIYPAYELEIEPRREVAWANAFNQGLIRFEEGDVESTREIWERATIIYDLRPVVHQSLGSLLMQEGEYARAAEVFVAGLEGMETPIATRVLDEEDLEERQERRSAIEDSLGQLFLFDGRFAEAEVLLRKQLEREPSSIRVRNDLGAALSGQGRDAEAAEIYSELLLATDLEARQLLSIGTSLFHSGDYRGAGEAFGRLVEHQPFSRNAWFNYANALYGAEDWESLVPVGERLTELDPLSETAGLILARALMELGDNQAALEVLERSEAVPVVVNSLELRTLGDQAVVRGQVTGASGNEAHAGASLQLRFSFYDVGESLGEEYLSLTIPAAGETADFEVAFDEGATAFRYDLVGDLYEDEAPDDEGETPHDEDSALEDVDEASDPRRPQ